jgi:phosphatidate cytidylyltransferase
MMKDLGRRLVVSVISIIAVVFLLVFAKQAFFQYVVALTFGALSAVASWEYAQFAKAKGGKPKSPALVTLSFLVTVSFFASWQFNQYRVLPPAIFLLAILILFALHFREQAGAIIDMAVSAFGLLYVALPLGMMMGILYFPMTEDGRLWVAYLLAVTKLTDVGAYFGGSLLGRHKLAPQISPAKTIEGALFGLVFAVAVSFLFYLIGNGVSSRSFHLSLIEMIGLGVVLGCVGQFGDLSESLLKRDANKKDSNILPGLGGVLDSVDSLLFNAPIVYVYIIVARTSTLL